MRVAPVGLANLGEATFDVAARTAAVTHGHPSGYLAAGALAVVIRELTEGQRLGAAFDRPRSELAAQPGSTETLMALDRALELEGHGSPDTLETLGGGWVAEEALAISAHCALAHPDDYPAPLPLAPARAVALGVGRWRWGTLAR